MDHPEHPIAAPATALIPSALSVIRCSGRGAIELVAACLHPGAALLAASSHTIHHGVFREGSGEVLDEVMVAIFRTPKSYTGEDSVEIYGHGSPAGVRRILTALYDAGFQPASPGEFTRRAFLNGKLDLTRAEAINDLVRSQTLEGHRLAVNRLGGAVQSAVGEVRSDLVTLMAQLSIQLDYPEEDTGDAGVDVDLLSGCEQRLAALAATFGRGRLVQQGVSVALAGRTNAGKSSLFNTLLRQDRSIVSDLPGTTRDYLEVTVDIGGIPVRLFDTAGLRPEAKSQPGGDGTTADAAAGDGPAGEPIEAEGIRRSRMVMAASDLVLFVLDATAGMSDEDNRRVAEIAETTTVLLVWNKTDLLVAPHTAPDGSAEHPSGVQGTAMPDTAVPDTTAPDSAVPVSALTGDGIRLLNQRIVEAVSAGQSTDVSSSDVVIDSARQYHLLTRAAEAVRHTRLSLQQGMPADVLAVDLQDALGAIGEITGEIVTDEILETMFGSFCVGK